MQDRIARIDETSCTARPDHTFGSISVDPVPTVMSGSASSGLGRNCGTDAMGHVWTAPGWQVLSSRVQQWSEQPCVRPVSAVHVTAGHNALRGSGPGQNHAFDNALAQVGCPDRRIDRLCITCCSPFPTVTSRRMPDAISVTPPVRRVSYNARPWSSSPTPSGRSCWRARWQRPWWADAPATP